MIEQKPANHKSPKSAWPLLIGLAGITYYVIGILVLAPPASEQIVNFWLIKLYGYTFPSLVIFLLGSILAVLFWCSRFANKSLSEIMLFIIGPTILCIGLYCSWSTLAFFPILSITNEVKQQDHTYFLARYYDDFAVNYYFCEADAIGFSGKCTAFTWLPSSSANPQFFIDQSTSLITATFDNPKQIWRMSTEPTHIYSECTP